MHNLNGDWVGSISGTNHGDVFVEMDQKDNTISGKARIHDRVLGVTIYQFTGIIDGNSVSLNLIPETREKSCESSGSGPPSHSSGANCNFR